MEQVEIDKCIWDFIDGQGSDAYIQRIDQRIKNDAIWTARFNELHHLATQLNALPKEQPSLRFTQNVMDQLVALPSVSAQSYINMRVIKSIAAIFMIIIAGALLYSICLTNWSPEGLFVDSKNAPSIIPSGMAIHVVLVINILLGLLFFEKISSRLFRQHR